MTTRNKKYLSGKIVDDTVFNNLMKYEKNIDNSQEVFTYEMGKYFTGMTYWCVSEEDKSVNFEYDELNTVGGVESVFDRVVELSTWLEETA
jgi:hypothetical protein